MKIKYPHSVFFFFFMREKALNPEYKRKKWILARIKVETAQVCFGLQHKQCWSTSRPAHKFMGLIIISVWALVEPWFAGVMVHPVWGGTTNPPAGGLMTVFVLISPGTKMQVGLTIWLLESWLTPQSPIMSHMGPGVNLLQPW